MIKKSLICIYIIFQKTYIQSHFKSSGLLPSQRRIGQSPDQKTCVSGVRNRIIGSLKGICPDTRRIAIDSETGPQFSKGQKRKKILHEILHTEYPSGSQSREKSPPVVNQQR